MNINNILLVEDSEEYQLLIKTVLNQIQCTTEIAPTGADAINNLIHKKYDLIILDMFLPDMSGMKIMEFIRIQGEQSNAPVLFLTSDEDLNSKVDAFNLGADDYLVKPINPIELRARLQSKLSKITPPSKSHDKFSIGDISIDIPQLKATIHENNRDETLDLTAKEFKILCLLAQNSGKTFNRQDIVKTIWGDGVHVLDRTVDSHICALRRKMKATRDYIQCIPSEGYRFSYSNKDLQSL